MKISRLLCISAFSVLLLGQACVAFAQTAVCPTELKPMSESGTISLKGNNLLSRVLQRKIFSNPSKNFGVKLFSTTNDRPGKDLWITDCPVHLVEPTYHGQDGCAPVDLIDDLATLRVGKDEGKYTVEIRNPSGFSLRLDNVLSGTMVGADHNRIAWLKGVHNRISYYVYLVDTSTLRNFPMHKRYLVEAFDQANDDQCGAFRPEKALKERCENCEFIWPLDSMTFAQADSKAGTRKSPGVVATASEAADTVVGPTQADVGGGYEPPPTVPTRSGVK